MSGVLAGTDARVIYDLRANRPTTATDRALFCAIDEGVVYQWQSGAWAAAFVIANLVPGSFPDVLSPVFSPVSFNSTLTITANRLYGCRVIAKKTGTLSDLSVAVLTHSGNAKGGVHDTGDAQVGAIGTRTRLWAGSSTPVAADNSWQSLGNPGLAVIAGQEYDIDVVFDNATVTISRAANSNNGHGKLPTGYNPVAGGASAKMAWTYDVGSFAIPTSDVMTEAALSASGSVPALIGHIA